jgi:hypothetical protein
VAAANGLTAVPNVPIEADGIGMKANRSQRGLGGTPGSGVVAGISLSETYASLTVKPLSAYSQATVPLKK